MTALALVVQRIQLALHFPTATSASDLVPVAPNCMAQSNRTSCKASVSLLLAKQDTHPPQAPRVTAVSEVYAALSSNLLVRATAHHHQILFEITHQSRSPKRQRSRQSF